MARTKPEEDRLESSILVSVKRATRREIESVCRSRNVSLSAFARKAVEEALKRDRVRGPKEG